MNTRVKGRDATGPDTAHATLNAGTAHPLLLIRKEPIDAGALALQPHQRHRSGHACIAASQR